MPNFERRQVCVGAAATLVLAGTGCQSKSAAEKSSSSPGFVIDYSSQHKVAGLSLPQSIVSIGIGGFGCWPALIAALSGVPRLQLIDMGVVDAKDLARAPFRPDDVGKPKAEAMARLLKELRPGIEITTQQRYITPKDTDVFSSPVLFDGTNEAALGEYLAAECKRRSVKYVQGFYNGMTVGTAQDHVPGLVFTHGEPVPVWGGAAMLSGCLAAASAFGEPINFFGPMASVSTNGPLMLGGGQTHADK